MFHILTLQGTLAASTLIILFSEMLIFGGKTKEITKICEGNY
jgi:hypothetical protein